MSDHLATFKTWKVKHPDFSYVYKSGGSNHVGPIVIFERQTYYSATPEALIDFDIRAKLIESLGGRIIGDRWKLGGETPVFTQADTDSILAAVRRDLPNYKITDKWNGLGCRTMSVAIEKKSRVEKGIKPMKEFHHHC